MEIINLLRDNIEVNELLRDFCDIEILQDYKEPQDQHGRLSYSIPGKAFAKDKSGGEYILLQDGSVGHWSSEGQIGRISENLNDFFTFVVNCPYWKDYVVKKPYENIEALRQFASEIYDEYVEEEQEYWEDDLGEVQKELAEKIGVSLYNNVPEKVLMKFYHSATREPRMYATYTEDDGSKHSNSGSLFET